MIVVFTVPAVGHVNPTLPVVRELVRRGERVAYYCGEAMRSVIEATGAVFRPIPEDFAVNPSGGRPSLSWIANEQLRTTDQWLPWLLEELKIDAPAFLLVDFMCIWGRFAGQVLGVPVVIFCSSMAIGPGTILPGPVLTALDVARSPRRLKTVAEFRRRAARLSQRFEVDQLRLPSEMLSMDGDRILVATSRMFQPNAHLYDERFHFVGPCFGPREGESHEALPPLDDRPLIYISLGTVFNQKQHFFQQCVEAFSDGQHQVLISIGLKGDAAALGAIPPHVHVRRFVSQLDVLTRAALFITHSGMNSTSEALIAEVPLLVYPQAADQFAIAKRVEELGVGLQIRRPQTRPAELRRLAERLLSSRGVRARCRAVRQSYLAAGGTQRAADILQEFQASLAPPKARAHAPG